eukprot:931223-Rhodomonas_salina.1
MSLSISFRIFATCSHHAQRQYTESPFSVPDLASQHRRGPRVWTPGFRVLGLGFRGWGLGVDLLGLAVDGELLDLRKLRRRACAPPG